MDISLLKRLAAAIAVGCTIAATLAVLQSLGLLVPHAAHF
ncbi:hypothetical protein CfE428DRAFT_5565 [Chthoniobacter flavus Ellin428]|uniref:Uncharacterized protein n=1 Tax=Chthoniobacter flavus Ellin428 TaxID=497964 RepID=B4D9H5_9BACT|nr:hypothetical protein CfE428DRAFT_5565 [Chthoniobacter flavus Ellin428]TCO87814.1 hypothetical protein EV701_120113 [Chthoniobacter flavus]